MKLRYLLCAVGGCTFGLSALGGTWMLFSLGGIVAFILAYLQGRNAIETPVPILQKDPTGRVTAIGTIVRPNPQTSTQATLRSMFAEPATNEPVAKVEMEKIWKKTEKDLTETLKGELNAIARLLPKVHTGAFFMYSQVDEVFILRAAVGRGAEALAKNAAFGSSGVLGGLLRKDVSRILEGDIPGGKAMQIYAGEVPVRSLAAVPVIEKRSGNRTGALVFDSLEPNAFSVELTETLSIFAATFQTICFKSYVSSKNFVEQQQYSALYTYQQNFFMNMSVKAVYEEVGKYLKENISYDRLMLLSLDADEAGFKETGRVVLCHGEDSDAFQGMRFSLSGKGLFLISLAKNHVIERTFTPDAYVMRLREDEYQNPQLRYVFMYPVTSSNDKEAVANFAVVLENYSERPYTNHEKQLVGAIANTAGFALKRTHEFERGQDRSERDQKTGLYNHTTFFSKFKSEKIRADRSKIGLGVLMMDIDHFKNVNDTHGHQAGDDIIVGIAKTIVSEVRAEIDLVGRFGGEEFVVELFDTDSEGTLATAERIRSAVEKTPFEIGEPNPLFVTVSIGAFLLAPGSRETVEQAVEFADQALYRAKEGGRNRVEEFLIQTEEPGEA